jgi:hypothetical protein
MQAAARNTDSVAHAAGPHRCRVASVSAATEYSCGGQRLSSGSSCSWCAGDSRNAVSTWAQQQSLFSGPIATEVNIHCIFINRASATTGAYQQRISAKAAAIGLRTIS